MRNYYSQKLLCSLGPLAVLEVCPPTLEMVAPLLLLMAMAKLPKQNLT